MRRSTAVPLGRSYLALASLATSAGLMTACARQPDRQVYCADRDGVIVDDDRCDGRDDRYYLWAGNYNRRLKPGQKLIGGTRIAYNDKAARERNGLPGTGKVSNGHVIKGGFGSSSSGSSGG
ncbi:hypothetical protein Drose_37025 [Dactylosporangium roseum]|uniref:Lipoprotein n=1 Tax=Dactylosporangium roseum TaxID=47989 RepID=A0ABY5Z845_9ACTN|nr:hypothetical protein [Dactylosporangium roseum]UWZ36554.1 hypothetical protein Drose_37025 [Dactylosporangium roseum]